jgi:hypothetical protein
MAKPRVLIPLALMGWLTFQPLPAGAQVNARMFRYPAVSATRIAWMAAA